MADLQIIGGKILTMSDLDAMNAAEVRSRKYRYCTIDAAENGKYLAKVEYSESANAWEPTHVKYEGEWVTIDEFDCTEEGGSYSCEDYRISA